MSRLKQLTGRQVADRLYQVLKDSWGLTVTNDVLDIHNSWGMRGAECDVEEVITAIRNNLIQIGPHDRPPAVRRRKVSSEPSP